MSGRFAAIQTAGEPDVLRPTTCQLGEVMVCNPCPMNDQQAWDALNQLQRLQDAVLNHSRDLIESSVSDRMIWVLPMSDGTRGKQEWIDASCGITWDWFDLRVTREVDLGTTRIVEAWISQQRQPTAHEVAQGRRTPVAAEGVVVDAWTLEDGRWRLVCRHPQRAQE
jgi:hypothetical protein